MGFLEVPLSMNFTSGEVELMYSVYEILYFYVALSYHIHSQMQFGSEGKVIHYLFCNLIEHYVIYNFLLLISLLKL